MVADGVVDVMPHTSRVLSSLTLAAGAGARACWRESRERVEAGSRYGIVRRSTQERGSRGDAVVVERACAVPLDELPQCPREQWSQAQVESGLR